MFKTELCRKERVSLNGQLPGEENDNDNKSPEDDQPAITVVELPISVSRAMSNEENSLADRKEFSFHIPLPAQVPLPDGVRVARPRLRDSLKMRRASSHRGRFDR